MGMYLKAPTSVGKADWFMSNYDATEVLVKPGHVLPEIKEIPPRKVMVVVVNNGPFDAALIITSEFDRSRVVTAKSRGDTRPIRVLCVPVEKVKEQYHDIEDILSY